MIQEKRCCCTIIIDDVDGAHRSTKRNDHDEELRCSPTKTDVDGKDPCCHWTKRDEDDKEPFYCECKSNDVDGALTSTESIDDQWRYWLIKTGDDDWLHTWIKLNDDNEEPFCCPTISDEDDKDPRTCWSN